jgi:signal transduction histidine kinase
VFEKFYRSPRARGIPGTVLGLAICRGIVEAHGGHVTMAPADGGGARVTIALPMEECDTVNADDSPSDEGEEI